MSKEIMDAVRETCMLVTIRKTALGMSRTDKAASQDVTRNNHAAAGTAKVVVNRLPGADAHHKAITAIQREATEIIDKHTMHFNEGWRLLPNRRFETLIQELAAVKSKFDKAMTSLDQNAAHIVRAAHANKGSFDIDLPTETELINAYSMETEFQPVPAGDHFRGLPESTAKKLAARLDARIAENVSTAQNDILDRFRAPIRSFIERMKAFDDREREQATGKEVGRVGVFRDTVVTNIRDLYNVLNSFNVTGDERLKELGELVKELAHANPEDLRKSATARDATVQRAKEIASNLDSWLTPVTSAGNSDGQ